MKSLIAALSFIVVAQNASAAVSYASLSSASKQQINNGQVVAVPVDVAGKPWPEVTAFVRIDSTPEEAAAVWHDYEFHKAFVPKLLKSRIVKTINASTVEVAYTLDLPWPVSDEDYTVRDTVTRTGNSYTVTWRLVRADSTKESRGFARFEPLGTGTLMTYYNFVVPGQSLAGLIANQAEEQVKKVASAVRNQVQKERASDTERLNAQLGRLHTALGQ